MCFSTSPHSVASLGNSNAAEMLQVLVELLSSGSTTIAVLLVNRHDLPASLVPVVEVWDSSEGVHRFVDIRTEPSPRLASVAISLALNAAVRDP